MSPHAPKVILSGLLFPEGPRWHDGRLWFSDVHQHKVIAVDEQGKAETIVTTSDRPSGLGYLPGGDTLIVQMTTRTLVRHGPRGIQPHADLSGLVQWFLNDMVVDGKGRAYVGGRNPRPEGVPQNDVVVLVTPDGAARIVADAMRGPNGSVVTPDGKTLIVAETHAGMLTAFDIAADGSLANRRLWAQLDDGRTADGICLDAEGCIWVGSPRHGQFLRVQQGGKVIDRITYPDKSAVACALGGKDRRTLFLLTSRHDVKDLAMGRSLAEDINSKSIGWIETVRVDIPGAGWP